ncbi:MAG: McrC family protein [Desulfomonilaceae bacterium]
MTAKNWVGSFSIGRYCIDVAPKIDDVGKDFDNSELDLRALSNLYHMVSASHLAPWKESDVSWLVNSGKPMVEAFLCLYVKKLEDLWKKGPIRRYCRIAENRSYLRGKMIFPIHVRQNSFHAERFFTEADEFISDNEISRLLKAALRFCMKITLGPDIARCASRIIAFMDEVSDCLYKKDGLPKINLDRSIKHFEKVINLARFILNNTSPAFDTFGEPVYSVMFDMNLVYERFIAAELKKALFGEDLRVIAQGPQKHLMKKEGVTKAFSLKPDISVCHGQKTVSIFDTKWKYLDKSKNYNWANQDDMYQMYAYGKAYDCPVVNLLYPHNRSLNQQTGPLAEYWHSNDTTRKVRILTIDLVCDMGLPENRLKLRKALASYVEHVSES